MTFMSLCSYASVFLHLFLFLSLPLVRSFVVANGVVNDLVGYRDIGVKGLRRVVVICLFITGESYQLDYVDVDRFWLLGHPHFS